MELTQDESLLEILLQRLAPSLYLRVTRDESDSSIPCDSTEDSPDENEDDLTSDSCETQRKEPCDSICHGSIQKNYNTWKHLQAREVGLNTKGQHSEGFSKTDQSCVFSRYLPNSVKEVIKYPAQVFCGSYSQDGSVFMSASQDCHIKLYETSTGKLRQFQDVLAQNVGWSIIDTAYSYDQRHLIYSSWSPNIYLCDITGSCDDHIALDMRPRVQSFCAFSITFSQDDREILAGSNDSCLYIYDRGCGRRTLRIRGHEDDVNAVCFSDDSSQLLFSGSDDGLCKVWDRRTLDEHNPEPVGTFGGHSAGIGFIDSKGDGHYLITNCKDQTIKLWDMRKFSSADGVEAGKKATFKYQWDYRWQPVPRKFSRGVNVKGDASVKTYRGHQVLKSLIRSYFSPKETTGQKYIYTGSSDGCVIIYDILTGQIVRKLEGHEKAVRDVSWHPYKPLIMTTSWDCTVKCWHYCRDREEREISEKETKHKKKKRRRLPYPYL